MVTRIEEPDIDQLETWQNATKGRVVLKRNGANGPRAEMIGPNKLFHITPVERRINQEAAATEELDVFLNGTLQPVRIPEDTEDYQALTSNPNLLGDDEQIIRLFNAALDVFIERLSEIKQPAALERLRELSQIDETGATVAQARAIVARLAEVQPELSNIHPDSPGTGTERVGSAVKAVTPR